MSLNPVLGPEGGVRYMASPLVTAMVRGGVCILDEGNRMSEKSWASLAPLLDHRRSVDSVVAGISIHAHEDFRFATTMNENASTYEVPEYIHSRLMPQITIDFPEEDEEREILRIQVGGIDEEVLEYVLGFLRAAHLALEQGPEGQELQLTYFLLADLYNRFGNSERELEFAELGRSMNPADGANQ